MALVTITKDAQNPHATQCIDYKAEGTLLECANKMLGEWEESPWICVLMRGEDRFHPLREEWGEVELQEKDKICFLVNIGDPVTIILAVVVILLVVAVLFLVAPSPQDTLDSGDPVFNIDGKKNSARLNQPIEDCYGRNKITPSYIMQPYTVYKDNRQYLYQRFSLGHGGFCGDDDQAAYGWHGYKVLINDSEIEDNENADQDNLSVFSPPLGYNGTEDTPDSRLTKHGYNNVAICRQVKTIRMAASNESDFDGWVGPFQINAPNTLIQLIENDISLPSGAYKIDSDGDVRSVSVGIKFQIREINKNSEPVNGTWVDLLNWGNSFQSAGAKRYSLKANAPYAARWEIRALRTDRAETSTKGVDDLVWDLCKGYRQNILQGANTGSTVTNKNWFDYPYFSMETIAATNTQANKVTVLCIRDSWCLLPPPSQDKEWYRMEIANPEYIRSPIWAMTDILRSEWGGRMRFQEDALMDLEAMRTAAEQAKDAGETFDWCFDKSMTVWDAIKMCCFVCRCTPTMLGGKLSVIRDVPNNIPIAIFNRENILSGSLKISRRIWNNDNYDGLKATYLDHETWQNETVVAIVGLQTAANPKTTNFRGVTNRDQAQKLANYLWASEYYNRQQIKFETDYNGIALTYGDMIKVCTDVSENGQDGYIVNIENNTTFTLSEIPVFSIGSTHTITFRKNNGEAYGPFEVVAVAGEEYKVELADPLVQIDPLLLPFDNVSHENPIYIFGPLESDGYLCKVNKVTSTSYDRIKVEAVVENFGRFEKDAVTAPPIYYETLQPIPLPPSMGAITATSYDEAQRELFYQWDAVADATSYVREYSTDGGDTWIGSGSGSATQVSVTFPSTIDLTHKEIILSVQGVNAVGTGERVTASYRADAPVTMADNEIEFNILTDSEGDDLGQVTLNTN